MQTFLRKHRWVKSVRIWSFYGPYFLYSVRMRKNTDQKTTNMDTFHAVHSIRARKKLKWSINKANMSRDNSICSSVSGVNEKFAEN